MYTNPPFASGISDAVQSANVALEDPSSNHNATEPPLRVGAEQPEKERLARESDPEEDTAA